MTKKHRGLTVLISGVFLALAFLFNLIKLDFMKDISLIAATAIAGYPIMRNAWQSARMKTFSIELLVTVAVIGALFIGEYVESAAVTFLFLLGAYLEARTLEKTRSSLKSLMDMAPREAKVLRDGKPVRIPIEEVLKGDRVLIQSGEKIAIDGKVAFGQGFINEASITGESVPARKEVHDPVFSGTVVDHGYLEVIAEKVGEDTAFAKIIELVEEAQESKAKTQKFLEKFASFYTPAILALSVIVFLFTRNIELTLTFLVIACPGALVISAPVSIVAGIGNGAKSGVLIKGGETMEHLSKINAVVFDKTGTLTKGRPEVTAIKAYRMEEELLLTRLAEAEVVSEHHLGRTIVQEALNRGLSLVRQPSDVEIAKGNGIKAVIGGETWAIGNRKWMGVHSVRLTDEVDAYAIEQEKQGNTAIFAAAGTDIMGVISIADQVRAEARESIRRLKDNGVKQIYMLTGDNRHTAEKVAQQLGIDQVFSELLPADKVAKIKEMKALGHKVAMVGDGINDAPAIAAADVGLAMGGTGTDAAMETADVVLMAGKLDQLVHACKLSKATVRNMKQNMFFAVSVVMILLAGVLTEHIFLASGMFIHELSVLLVIVNATRLVGYNRHQRGNHRHESMRSARPGRIKC